MSAADTLEERRELLDSRRLDRPVDTNESMHLAKERAGVPFAQQSRDMLSLRRGSGGIEPNEYYYFGLYDRTLFDDAARAAFLGRWRVHRMASAFNEEVFGKTGDKVAIQRMLAAVGIAVPRTLALYNRDGTVDEGIRHVGDIDDLRRLFLEIPSAGLFGKPVSSVGSLGVISIDGFDVESDRLQISDGGSVSLREFVVELKRYEEDGYQFQERLHCHFDIKPILGNRIGTLRVLVANDGEPQIVRTSWKIPTGTNMADNFWRKGNLLAAVEPETGRVYRVVDDVYPRLKEVTEHPDSHVRLIDFMLPDWREMREMVIEASRTLTGLPLLGWDVALTDRGPVIVEVEGNGGHPMMTQLAQGRGLLEEPAIRSVMEKMRKMQPSMPVLLFRYIRRKVLGKAAP